MHKKQRQLMANRMRHDGDKRQELGTLGCIGPKSPSDIRQSRPVG
jgi:hypothetical protein